MLTSLFIIVQSINRMYITDSLKLEKPWLRIFIAGITFSTITSSINNLFRLIPEDVAILLRNRNSFRKAIGI